MSRWGLWGVPAGAHGPGAATCYVTQALSMRSLSAPSGLGAAVFL
eukprot:COSAG01_NODE_296_length_19281_cov_212.029507_1_plen_44_part_10